MEVWKLLAVFALIITFVKYRYPLWSAMMAGMALTAILFGVPADRAARLIYRASVSNDTIVLLLAFYSITFLQRMMEKRAYLRRVERAMEIFFRNRRLNLMLTPMVIGLLPAAGAVLLAAPIVDRSAGEWLTKEEKTFVTSYYRHIPESFLPTYSSILLALQLSGFDMTRFVLLMLPMVAALVLMGYVFYVRRVPAEVDAQPGEAGETGGTAWDLLCVWPIAVTVAAVLILKIRVYIAILPVALIFAVTARFSPRELIPMLYSAAEKRLLFTTAVIMQFKEILMYTGVLSRLPEYFQALVLPPAIIFGLIFFIGTLISGGQAMIALCLPMSLIAVPDGGMAFFVFVMCVTYIAMQISPAHICLEIVCGAFETDFISLIRKTMPVLAGFLVISGVYCYGIYLLGL